MSEPASAQAAGNPERAAIDAAGQEISALSARLAILERQSEKVDFQAWTAILTLSALAIYGAARFGDAAFYARLGTDADAVGLTYGVTLARVGTTVAVSGASMLALFLCGRLWGARNEERLGQGPWTTLFSITALVFAFVLTLLQLVLFIPPQLITVTPVRNIVALAGTVGIFAAGRKYQKARDGGKPFSRTHAVIAGAVALVLLFGLAAVTGYRSASYVMRGLTLPCPCVSVAGYNITLPWSSGTNGFLGIKAELADVQWIGSGASRVPSYAVLLGESDSSVVLYDFGRRAVLIVPADQVIVSPQSNLTGFDEH